MTIGEVVAVYSLVAAVLGVVFQLGRLVQRVDTVERTQSDLLSEMKHVRQVMTPRQSR
jgi:hypothetical protein